jgi:hypothetical protein
MRKISPIFILLIILSRSSYSQELTEKQKRIFELLNQKVYNQFQYFEMKRDPNISALMSLTIPGSGHFYNHNKFKGAMFLTARVTLILLAINRNNTHSDQGIFQKNPGQMFLGSAILAFVDLSIAYQDSKQFNKGLRDKLNIK